MGWAKFWAIFSQTNLVTLPSYFSGKIYGGKIVELFGIQENFLAHQYVGKE
jgi:hypothetical protein